MVKFGFVECEPLKGSVTSFVAAKSLEWRVFLVDEVVVQADVVVFGECWHLEDVEPMKGSCDDVEAVRRSQILKNIDE